MAKIFSKTRSITSFIKSVGGNSMDIIKSPKTGAKFFVVPGTEEQGRIAKNVTKLSVDLSVSWFIPEDAKSEEEHSWLLHKTGSTDNVVDSFSI